MNKSFSDQLHYQNFGIYMTVIADVPSGAMNPNFSALSAPTVTDPDKEEPQALTFHGLILRSQLVTLLKERVFYSENSQVKLVHAIDILVKYIGHCQNCFTVSIATSIIIATNYEKYLPFSM